jgi:CRP/FNR family transcriptional regulator, cyclic AMP receptor protein
MSSMLQKNLYDLSLFHGLTREQIDQILPLLEPCSFPEETRVFQQDLKASHFYILLKGEIVVKYKPYDGEELVIARISPEDVFGWSAPLGRSKYTSSAYAVIPCEAVRIDIARMQHFCGSNSKLGEIILERLASSIAFRLRSTYDEVLSLLNRGMDLVPEK